MNQELAGLLTRFTQALQDHFSLVTSGVTENDETVVDQAYQAVQEAFIAYDNALYEATSYDLPFDIYDLDIEDAGAEKIAEGIEKQPENRAGGTLSDIGLAAYAVSAVGDDADVPDGDGQVLLQHIDLDELGLAAEVQAELEDKIGSYLQDEDSLFHSGFGYQLDDEEYDFDDSDSDEDEDEELDPDNQFDEDNYEDDFLDDCEEDIYDDDEIALDYDLVVEEETEK